MKNYTSYFSEFLDGHKGYLHFRGHSHHFWPDVTKNAILEYFNDSKRLSDDKWEKIFGEKIPLAQKLISEILQFTQPKNIVFAPNTHELVFRLITALLSRNKKIKILTTDSEFLSFDRQIKRLLEEDWIELKVIATNPFFNIAQDVIKAGKTFSPDLVFISQVFFNSGVALYQEEIEQLAFEFRGKSLLVIDGYHAFMAIPTSLSKIGNDIFYLAGSYKYLGAGEGLCFMTIPEGCNLRPVYTGWFADLAHLDSAQTKIYYPNDGLRFAGSTMDFSSLYKLIAVLENYKREEISVLKIHKHVQDLQKYFLEECRRINHPVLNQSQILIRDLEHHGHFFSFKVKDESSAKNIAEQLKLNKILVDTRGDRVRFGFAIYHQPNFKLNFSGISNTNL